MPRLLRIFAVLLATFFTFAPFAKAATHHISWGFESWQCGNSWFGIQIGNGTTPVYITGVTGVLSASALPAAYPGTANRSSTDTTQVIAYQRQALVTLTSDTAMATPIDSRVFLNPSRLGAKYEESLDENYFAVDIKQDGFEDVHVPLNYTFPGGILIANGQLKVLVDAQTSNGKVSVTTNRASASTSRAI